MSQLNAYIDHNTLKKIELAAKIEHISISRWVRNKLTKALEHKWPKNYETVFGALSDTNLERPPILSFKKDKKRESL